MARTATAHARHIGSRDDPASFDPKKRVAVIRRRHTPCPAATTERIRRHRAKVRPASKGEIALLQLRHDISPGLGEQTDPVMEPPPLGERWTRGQAVSPKLVVRCALGIEISGGQ